MFQVRSRHVRRISFATKLFPKLKSALGLDTTKLNSTTHFDGELFCGGRSRNKDLLTFFGFISDNSGSASFVQLPTFRRSLKKLINLVEHELEKIGAQEVLLPALVPEKLWHKSKRLERQQNALDHVYKLTDAEDNKLILGPTFEETITQLMRDVDTITDSELPLLLYQTSSKFRMEPNPRFGLLRSNEFLMNDLYSFDASPEKAVETYNVISETYKRIFTRLRLDCHKIESATGSIGGKYSHEYQLEVSSGEDTIIKCNSCKHAYNVELNVNKRTEGTCLRCGGSNLSNSQALELGHTFLLSDTYSKPLGAKFNSLAGDSGRYLEMGCYGLGLSRILGAGVDLMSLTKREKSNDSFLQIRWPNEVEPYRIGLVGPAKRSKEFHGGSTDFVGRLANNLLDSSQNLDILVEDRDKEGILKRLLRLKSLGIPYILVVGQRFLQERPEIELLKLDSKKEGYTQNWFTEDQVYDYFRELDRQLSD